MTALSRQKRFSSKAKADGFSEKTIKRAKVRAGIEHYREGFGAKSKSMWASPEPAPYGDNTPSNRANNAELGPVVDTKTLIQNQLIQLVRHTGPSQS